MNSYLKMCPVNIPDMANLILIISSLNAVAHCIYSEMAKSLYLYGHPGHISLENAPLYR